ncbi:MAG: HEAT repeat domain-containing protein [Elusimicrobiota bacterium]
MDFRSRKSFTSGGARCGLWRKFFVFSFVFLIFGCLYADELLVQQYIKGLKDKKKAVRIESAQKLGEIGKPDVVAPLRDALNDKSDDVRVEVVKALSKIQDDTAISAIAVAVKDKDDDVRMAAVDSLSSQNSKAAIGPLIEATKDKNNSVKKSAINLLGTFSDSSLIPTLSNCLKDKNINVRLSAVYAAGSIGGIDAIRALSVALDDKEDNVSIVAINVLGALGDQNATPLLTAILRQKRGIVVHNAVADALINLGDKSAIPSIVEFLETIDEEDKDKFRTAIIKILEKNKSVSSKKETLKIKHVEPPTPVVQEIPPVQPAETPVQQSTGVPQGQQVSQTQLSQQEKLKFMGEHYSAGVSLYEKREYEKAIAEWEEVLKLDPNHKQSKKMTEKARKMLKK